MTDNTSQTQTSGPAPLTLEMLKEKERILWDEVRNIREITLKLLQWSVTALASLEIALFYVRKDVHERMVAAGYPPSEPLPWDKRLRGTIFLLVVALFFTLMIYLAGRRRKMMGEQLGALNAYQIDYGKPTRWGRPLMLAVPLIFPIMDWLLHS